MVAAATIADSRGESAFGLGKYRGLWKTLRVDCREEGDGHRIVEALTGLCELRVNPCGNRKTVLIPERCRRPDIEKRKMNRSRGSRGQVHSEPIVTVVLVGPDVGSRRTQISLPMLISLITMIMRTRLVDK